jgi:hypothetical protein
MKSGWLRSACALALVCCGLGAWAAPGGATPPPRLLAQYQPALHLHPAESFGPTSIQSFVADSQLERRVGGSWVLVDADPEPGELPGGEGWRLNQESCSPAAVLGGLECYAAAWGEGSGGPAVYGRVAHDGDRIVLEYWYFYYHDVYSYPFVPAGTFWQAHEGDWENVNVVLSGDEQPLSVGYSQHCLGQTREWSATPRVGETHPVVYVALGSHANYFTTGLHQFNLACVPPQVLALLNQYRLPPPADVVSADGAVSGPPEADGSVTVLHHIDEGEPSWVSFAGQWGEAQFFHAPPPIGTVPLGSSPVGPAFHDVWLDPLATLATWPAG